MRRSGLLALFLLLCTCSPSGHPLAESERLFRAGNFAAAEKRLDQCRNCDGWPALLLRAELKLRRGSVQDAARILDSAPALADPLSALRRDRLRATIALRSPGVDATALTARFGELAARSRSLNSRPEQIEALLGRGRAERMREDNQRASSTYREARDLARASGDRVREALCLFGEAALLLSGERFDAAARVLRQGLELLPQRDADGFRALLLGNLAHALARSGQFPEALRARQEAIDLETRAGAGADLAEGLGDLGNIHYRMGNLKEAARFYDQAVGQARTVQAQRSEMIYLSNRVLVLSSLGEIDAARAALAQAQALADKVDGATKRDLIRAEAHVAEASGDPKRAVELLQLHTAAEPRALIRWSSHNRLGRLLQNAEPKKARNHFEAAIRDIESLHGRTESLDASTAFLSPVFEPYQRLQELLAGQGDLAGSLRVIEASRARSLPGLARGATPAGLQTLARGSGVALVSYWVAPAGSHADVITARGWRRIKLPPEAEIRALVARHQKLILSQRNPREMPGSASWKLADAVGDPVWQEIGPGQQVVIVPDGPLWNLNFETLPVGQPRRYWIEEASITVAPSLSSVRAAGPGPGPRRLLLIGDPLQSEPEFGVLSRGPEEVRAVAGTFEAGQSVRLTGAEASAEAYARTNLEGFTHIHFAAHALSNPNVPLDSGVILSGTRLYARDIAERKLNARLVTLSGCRAAGETAVRGEGLLGFAWAFLHAGAGSVAAGIWDVSQDAAPVLMERFYVGLRAGATPPRALREAKLSFLKNGGNPAKPWYWAPLIHYSAEIF